MLVTVDTLPNVNPVPAPLSTRRARHDVIKLRRYERVAVAVRAVGGGEQGA